jgi:hypothetical protein
MISFGKLNKEILVSFLLKNGVLHMRYIATIFWAVIITFVLSYVLSSMANEPLDLVATLVMAAIFSIIVFVLGDGLLRERKEQ